MTHDTSRHDWASRRVAVTARVSGALPFCVRESHSLDVATEKRGPATGNSDDLFILPDGSTN